MAKMDWGFTADGDLALGTAKTDERGYVLFRHADGTIDTDQRSDGKEIRDIGVAEGLEAEKQTIVNRLRTDAPDWYHHPGMGGNLTDLIGEPNTRATGEMGAAFIRQALTYSGLYGTSQVAVRPVPISTSEILFLIEISKFDNEVVRLPLMFSLEHGLVDDYSANHEGV